MPQENVSLLHNSQCYHPLPPPKKNITCNLHHVQVFFLNKNVMLHQFRPCDLANQAKEARGFGLIKVQCGTEGKLRAQITTKTWNPTTQRFLRTRGRGFLYMESIHIWSGMVLWAFFSFLLFLFRGGGVEGNGLHGHQHFLGFACATSCLKLHMVVVSRSNDQLSIHKFTIEKKNGRLPEP